MTWSALHCRATLNQVQGVNGKSARKSGIDSNSPSMQLLATQTRFLGKFLIAVHGESAMLFSEPQ